MSDSEGPQDQQGPEGRDAPPPGERAMGPTAKPRFGAEFGRATPVSYMLDNPDGALGVRLTARRIGAESGRAGIVGAFVERTSYVLERVGLAYREGESIPRPELAVVEFGSSAELGFLAPGGHQASGEDEDATVEAARRVAAVIGSPEASVAEIVNQLGEGVGAFEQLLQALADEPDAVLDWHARGREPVAVSSQVARTLLRRLRSERFVAQRPDDSGRVGLVLMAGGARGAYEAGALSILLPLLEARGQRPRVFAAAGTGAINAAALVSFAHLPAAEAASRLLRLWRDGLGAHNFYAPLLSPSAMFRTVLGYFAELTGIAGPSRAGLLDPVGLHALLELLDFQQLEVNIHSGAVDALGVVAASVISGRCVVFTTTTSPLPSPDQVHAIDYASTRIADSHISASAALPFLFPPVHVQEPAIMRGWYVQAGTRLTRPLAPVLAFGASEIVVLSTAPRLGADWEPEALQGPPDLYDTFASLLQSVMADRLVEDVRMTARGDLRQSEEQGDNGGRTRVRYLLVSPTHRGEIGTITSEILGRKYGGLRGQLRNLDAALLVRTFGIEEPRRGDLMSNVMFDREVIEALIALGARDAVRALDTAGHHLTGPGP